jgi:hypothetical protein
LWGVHVDKSNFGEIVVEVVAHLSVLDVGHCLETAVALE